MRTIAIGTLAVLFGACGGSKGSPCTTCANVQGTYQVTVDAKDAESSTCHQLYIEGGSYEMELYQIGSELEMPAFFGSEGGLKGTLMEDDSARFGPLQVRVGNTETYANTVLNGSFTGEEASRRFSGSLIFSAVLEGTSCALTTPVRMVKKNPTP